MDLTTFNDVNLVGISGKLPTKLPALLQAANHVNINHDWLYTPKIALSISEPKYDHIDHNRW